MFITDYANAHHHHDRQAREWHRLAKIAEDVGNVALVDAAEAAADVHGDAATTWALHGERRFGVERFDAALVELDRAVECDGQQKLVEAAAGLARRVDPKAAR